MAYAPGPPKCGAQLSDGSRCPNEAVPGSHYCRHHRYLEGNRIVAGAIGGALVGNLFYPGVGAVIGGIIGGVLSSSSTSGSPKKQHG